MGQDTSPASPLPPRIPRNPWPGRLHGDAMSTDAVPPHSGVARPSGARLVALGILVSRIFGLLRQKAIGWFFGLGPHADILASCSTTTELPCTAGNDGTQIAASRSHHTGGVQVGLADGSCRFISENISQAIYQALGTRANREVIDNF